MSSRRRLLAALRPVRTAMALSIAGRIVYLTADLVLVGAGTWGVASLALSTLDRPGTLLLALAAGASVKALARYVEQYQGHHVAFGLLAEMRTDFFRRVAPLAPAALADTRSGDLVDRVMSDVDRVEVFYAHTVAPVVAGVVVPVLAVVGVSVWAGPAPGLVLAIAMLLVGVVVPFATHRTSREATETAAEAGGDLAAHVTDGVQGLGEAVVFDYGSRRRQEMGDLAAEVGEAEKKVAVAEGARAGVNRLLTAGAFAAVAVVGMAAVREGALDPAVLAGTLAVSLLAFTPLRDLQQVKPAYDRAMAAADRVFSISDRLPLVTDPADPHPTPQAPELRFESVGFSYPGRGPALQDVDLTVAPGRKVAIVGTSGAGKSTLASLAIRLWDPDEGRITLDSVDIARLRLEDLRRTVTVVSQRSHLLSGTVADNLRLGRPDATQEAMRQAAVTAAVADDIASLPDAYETQVGEHGVRLSGGQRQRIALARGLLSRAPVLILDEATSEIDVDTEAELLGRLDEAVADRALIVIAHRLAAVTDADEILVMERGAVVERGTHQELLRREGLYARLWARQRDEL